MHKRWNLGRTMPWVGFVMLAGLIGVAAQTRADDKQAPDCLVVHKLVTYRAYGYDHVVRFDNTCPSAVSCELATDATPEPQHVNVAAGAHRDVLTHRGSPASAFQYSLRCTGGS